MSRAIVADVRRIDIATALRRIVVLLVISSSSVVGAEEVDSIVARADQLFAERRDIGQVRGLAKSEPIGEIVMLYEQAAAARPDDLAIALKLLIALEYKAIHALPKGRAGALARRPVVNRGIAVCEDALDRTATRFGDREELYGASVAEIRAKGVDVPVLAEVYFWCANHWVARSLDRGIRAAVDEGTVGTVYEHTNQVLRLDPSVRQGGGYRFLAQLHIVVPRETGKTDWADPEKAIDAMEQAEAIAPGDPHNKLFLAQVLMRARPNEKERIRSLLLEASNLVPRSERVCEDWDLKNGADRYLAAMK